MLLKYSVEQVEKSLSVYKEHKSTSDDDNLIKDLLTLKDIQIKEKPNNRIDFACLDHQCYDMTKENARRYIMHNLMVSAESPVDILLDRFIENGKIEDVDFFIKIRQDTYKNDVMEGISEVVKYSRDGFIYLSPEYAQEVKKYL